MAEKNNILGISAYYHDSSACLFQDGKLVFACEEEKFTGIKHDSSFPINAIDYIKKHYTDKFDLVCYYEKPSLKLLRAFKHNWKSIPRILCINIKLWFELKKISKNIFYSTHHDSHLMYSYYSSPFTDATLVSVDGVGEEETLKIVEAKNGEFTTQKTITYPHSLGLLYSAITAYLGFKPNEGEYKVMGLASYGDPTKYKGKFRKLLCYRRGLQVDMSYFSWNESNKVMFNHKLIELLGDNRLPNEPITQRHKDIAASLQWIYEKALFHFLNEYPGENLCLSGGCAYNGTANGKIKENTSYKNVWIPASPSDAGSCIGACLNYLKVRIPDDPFLGPEYDLEFCSSRTLDINTVAKELNNGKVVGWYEGRIEFGARALGHRSILANPTLPKMQNRINALIKKREMFRPFAPMVLKSTQNVYFESNDYVPYMNQVVKVKEEYRTQLPAVTHIDGTARIQTVHDKKSKIFKLLKSFETQSGFPILLNTSFNIKDKTMVLTPEDAFKTFVETDMDILVINNKMYYKNDKID
jgi:carbamoyltransferase